MNRRLWTAAAWIALIALLVLGARAWPLELPWFLLIGFAASEEAIFLLINRPTLSQRYWAIPPRAKAITAAITTAAMIVLWGHLNLGWFR